MINPNEWTPSDVPNYNYCFNRLPCGICRITNQPCPKATTVQPGTPFPNTPVYPNVIWDTANGGKLEGVEGTYVTGTLNQGDTNDSK